MSNSNSGVRPAALAVRLEMIGREQSPLIVIDGISPDPRHWVADAAERDFRRVAAFYPGIQTELPRAYLDEVMPTVAGYCAEVFGFRNGLRVEAAYYSLVTQPPETLEPPKRVPHIDGVEEDRLAVLHYLCGPNGGGTAFYRHRSTGFETVSDLRYRTYQDRVERELREHGVPEPGYFEGSDELFEETGRMEARFNRLIVYRSKMLHSGVIPDDLALSGDPAEGRLTANTFLRAA